MMACGYIVVSIYVLIYRKHEEKNWGPSLGGASVGSRPQIHGNFCWHPQSACPMQLPDVIWKAPVDML
jgi:hypothetical protein